MAKLFIEDLDVKGKRVLVRVDFNVPLDEKGHITDDTRIRAALPTICYIVERGGKAILMSHLGRPKDTVDPKLQLDPVGKRLQELLPKNKVTKLSQCIGPEVEKAVAAMKPGEVILLENLRFHKEEQKNDPEFAQQLARLGDIYVDDAFGTSHRADASIVGVTRYIPQCAAGYLLKKEIQYLGDAVSHPQHPFVAILGGAKVSDKIQVITHLLGKVDAFIIGGGMAYTFLKAMGKDIGKSLLEVDKVELAKQILEKAKSKKVDILLPMDHVTTDCLDPVGQIKVSKNGIESSFLGADIGPDSIKLFSKRIEQAKTVVWNGPMGIFEKKEFSHGTLEIAKAIAQSKATSIIGGGDSVAALQQSGLSHLMTHISTGGGASLEYLEGKELPGIAALTEK